MGLLAFNAPYLPWVLLGFSLLLGHDVTSDALGIAVGHVYYFFAGGWHRCIACARASKTGGMYSCVGGGASRVAVEASVCIVAPCYHRYNPPTPRADVYPALAAARGWRWRKLVHTPWLL